MTWKEIWGFLGVGTVLSLRDSPVESEYSANCKLKLCPHFFIIKTSVSSLFQY